MEMGGLEKVRVNYSLTKVREEEKCGRNERKEFLGCGKTKLNSGKLQLCIKHYEESGE